MYEAVKVTIDPSPREERLLLSNCGGARFAYNTMLNYIEDCYKNNIDVKINFYNIRSMWHEMRDKVAPWHKINSKECYANAIANLCQSYKNFFDSYNGKRKDKVGKPKYKKLCSNRSFTLSSGYFKINNKNICLSKIGWIHSFENIQKRVGHGKMKSCNVSTDGLKWYVSILVEREDVSFMRKDNSFIGIDLGLINLATTSDGELIENPKYLNKFEAKLKKELKILARKQGFRKGEKKSKKYIKQLLKVRKLHAKVRNCRKDNIEKITTEICKHYKNICIEDLKIKSMQKNHRLAKSLSDASLAMFRTYLEKKAKKYDNIIYVIDTYYPSSKTCSNCGHVKTKLDLGDRTYVCEKCGNVIDRDYNAALNLENIARLFAESTSENLNAHGENVRLVSLKDIKRISMKCESGLADPVIPEVLTDNGKIEKTILRTESECY